MLPSEKTFSAVFFAFLALSFPCNKIVASSASIDLSSSYLSWIPNSTSQVQRYMPNEGNIKFSTLVNWMPSGEFKTSQIQIESSSIKGSLNSNPYTLSNVICTLSNGLFEISDLDYNWSGNIGEVSSRIISFDDASKGGQIQGSVQISAESIVVDPIFNWWGKKRSTNYRQKIRDI